MKTRIFQLFIVATTFFAQISVAKATLGPVHVELNMTKPKIAATRANTLTAFKIYFCYNITIKPYDWIKIWFPIDEYMNSENPLEFINGICDGLPNIKGSKENVRFIPNDKYFEKFSNEEIKKVGFVYEMKDSKGATEFFKIPDGSKIPDWGDICNGNTKIRRIIKDPSGLGFWQLGTVFPPLPFDVTERMERIKTMTRSMSVGYSPCMECSGYPMFINSCKERSIKAMPGLEIEAWRKGYNSIDFNTSKNTGIIAPATPGRYRVAIATQPEPEPVESEAFVLPCSDVSNVEFKDSSPNKENIRFALNFVTGEGGALDGGSSTIMLRFPKNFILPKKFPAKSILVNGINVTSQPQIALDQLTLVVPTDIPNMEKVEIDFLDHSGITINNANESLIFEVSTSSEPSFIKSKPFKPNSTPFTTVIPNTELTNSWIRARCILDENEEIAKDSTIKINFPDGFPIPRQIDPKNIIVNDVVLATPISVEGNVVAVSSPSAIKGALTISFLKGTGLINPAIGKYKITMNISDKLRDCGEFETVPLEGSIFSVELSENRAMMPSKIKIDFIPSSLRMLEPGDSITVIFPTGSTLPSEFDKEKITINKQTVLDAAVNGTELVLKISNKIYVYERSTIIIDIGIKNPKRSDNYVISLSTSKGDWLESKPYHIESGPLTTSISFSDPDKPVCDIWFNKSPLLSLDCSRNYSKTYIRFNDDKDDELYESPIRMPYTNELKTIHFYSSEYSEKEKLQKYEYGLDVTPPKFNILSPKEEKIYINTPYIDFEIERLPQNLSFHGITNSHRIVDDLYYVQESVKTVLLPGQLYSVEGQANVTFEVKQRIDLPIEGENIIEFVSRDFACNETVVRRTIIKDTTAPEIEVLEPVTDKIFVEGDEIHFKVRTQSGSSVTINGNKMKVESDDGINAIYAYVMKASIDLDYISIVSTDRAGNTSKLTGGVKVKPKTTVIKLTLDKTEWSINDILQPPLKTAPTTFFTNPAHKALNGTTYMPIADIASHLDCKTSWEALTKTVTLVQTQRDGKTKTILMQLNKTTALVDGVEVKYNSKGTLYPVSIGGKTMLPLRFVAEVLGASISYEAKSKTITIVYEN